MKLIKTVNAKGHILCHDITRIVKDISRDAAFRKGHVVTEEDIPKLLALGKEWLYIWENYPGMLHENDAAQILYKLCATKDMHPTKVKEGKIEVIADIDGLLEVDIKKLRSINELGEIIIATRKNNTPVNAGHHLAGMRVIPLVIDQKKMDSAVSLGENTPILTLHGFLPKKYAIVTIGNEVYKGLIKDTFTPVIRQKIREFKGEEIGHIVLDDNHEAVTNAILDFIQKGAQVVLCTGGMSVDPDDRTPLAIRNTHANVIAYGAPVLPGAMFMLAYKGSTTIMGLPGCVMYAKRTIFDLILPRVMADVAVTSKDLSALGHGGLCLNCEVCSFPNCSFGSGM